MQTQVLSNSSKENRKIYQKTYQQRPEVKEKLRLATLAYYQRNKETRKAQMREYSKAYYNKNKEKLKEQYCIHYQENKESYKAAQKEWYQNNKEKRITYNTQYKINRRKIDPVYRLKDNIRGKIRKAIKNKNGNKFKTFSELLGCTFEEACKRIEQQWQPGMSWDNYGLKGWHIDHIKPINTFDLTCIEEQKKCFHYTNLRPLWAKDNLKRPKDGSDVC